MLAKAIQRNVRVSAKKATLVCRLIKDKPLATAMKILQNQDQKTSKFLLKLLSSAAANAVNNHAMRGDQLYVFNSVANQGPSLKRSSPRAKGRTDMIKRRTSHLLVILSDDTEEKAKLNKILLKPRAHQYKYQDKKLKDATEIKSKKMHVSTKTDKK